MKAISSKALNFGNPENKKNKFQDQEFGDDFGINYYEFKYRNHDPQIGRFIQVDPLSEKYEYNSTYAFSENKVIGHVELEGLESSEPELPATQYEAQREFYKDASSNNNKKANEWRKKNDVVNFTVALTKGEDVSLGLKGKVFGIGYSACTYTEEKDLVGLRDNKIVADGTEASSNEMVSRTGDSFTLGVIGFTDETETKKSSSGGPLSESKTFSTTKLFVKKSTITDKKGAETTEKSLEIFNLKVGVVYGIELGLEIKSNPYSGGTAPPLPQYGSAQDNTRNNTIPYYKIKR